MFDVDESSVIHETDEGYPCSVAQNGLGNRIVLLSKAAWENAGKPNVVLVDGDRHWFQEIDELGFQVKFKGAIRQPAVDPRFARGS